MDGLRSLSTIQLGLAAILLTLTALHPVRMSDFVSWDDGTYILDNKLIRDLSWESVKLIFSEKEVLGTYSPIVLLTWAFDHAFNGLDPKVFHTMNLLWHCLNVLLVFLLIHAWTGKRWVAFFVSLLFGIHPMNVEVVAWATGRKDLVYGFFFLFSLLAYHQFAIHKKKWWLLASLILFTLSVLSKAVAVVIPLVLLALDHYLYNRKLTWKTFLEKVPFLIISVGLGTWAILGQQSTGAISQTVPATVYVAPFTAMYGTVLYVLKMFYPFRLSAFHPYPFANDSDAPWYIFASCLPILMGILLFLRLTKAKPLMRFGGFFFIVCILPTIQLIPIGSAILAERYVYMAYIGLFLTVALGLERLFSESESRTYRKVLVAGFSAYVVLLSALSYAQSKVWKDSISLWTNVVQSYSNDPMAYNNLGLSYAAAGDLKNAKKNFNRKIELQPEREVFNNRGHLYMQQGNFNLALTDLNAAIMLDPEYGLTWLNRGVALMNLGRNADALESLLRAQQSGYDQAIVYFDLGLVYERLGFPVEALTNYTKAIERDSNQASFYHRRARLLGLLFRLDEAMSDVEAGLKLDGENVQLIVLRSELRSSKRDYVGALEDAMQAHSLGMSIDSTYMNRLLQLTAPD